MQLAVFRALWGMTGAFDTQIEQIAGAGYDGIEGFIGATDLTSAQFTARVAEGGLKLIMAGAVDSKAALEPTLLALAEYQPIKIGLHSGRDSMTRDEGCAFFEVALRLEQKIGIPVSHETHRGRMFFTPWETAYYLREFPSLKIVADYSHWVNVCERLPKDQQAALDLANERTFHIHARVGYEEGPQVPDPSALEYANQLAWHEQQWQAIIRKRAQAGDALVTVTPEYGPPMYLHTLPHTNVPVADLWNVCLWGARRFRQMFSAMHVTAAASFDTV
jgi:sugar phosphate isomerase/epimerase